MNATKLFLLQSKIFKMRQIAEFYRCLVESFLEKLRFHSSMS